MAYGAGTDSLKARLKRLEDRAGKGQRNCPSCRLFLRTWWPDPTMPRARPADFVSVVCDYCHTDYAVYLGIFPEEERDAWRLWLPCSWEMRYLNSKAHALGLWLAHRQQRDASPANEQWQHQQHYQNATALGMVKGQTTGQRLVSRLRQEVSDFQEKYTKRLRAVHGEGPSRELRDLIASVRARAEAERNERSHVKGLEWFETRRTTYLILAELEKIIWGEVRPKTSRKIAILESLIDVGIKKKDEEAAKMSQAEERQKKIETENCLRRWRGLPLLPDDYEGDFTSYSDFFRMRPDPANCSTYPLTMKFHYELSKPFKTFHSPSINALRPITRFNSPQTVDHTGDLI